MPKNIRFPAGPVGSSAVADKPMGGKALNLAPKGKMQGKHAAPVARRLEVPGKGRAR